MAGVKGEELKRFDHRYHTPHKLVGIVRKSVECKRQLSAAIWNYIAALAATPKADMVVRFVRQLKCVRQLDTQLYWIQFLSDNYHESARKACISGPRRSYRTTALCLWAAAEAKLFPGTRICLRSTGERTAKRLHFICKPVLVKDALENRKNGSWDLHNGSVIQFRGRAPREAQQYSIVAFDDLSFQVTDMEAENAFIDNAKFVAAVGVEAAEGVPSCTLMLKNSMPPSLKMEWSYKTHQLAIPVMNEWR